MDLTAEKKSNTDRYELVARAIKSISESKQEILSPAQLAKHLGVSGLQLTRLFKSWAGITPSRFIQFVSYLRAADGLRAGNRVMDTALDGGFSSASRLYDCTVNIIAMTPGELIKLGGGVSIRCGLSGTPFGEVYIAWTPRGICSLQFISADFSMEQALQRVQDEWPAAEVEEDQVQALILAGTIFSTKTSKPVKLDVRGTNFQVQVWRALLDIPFGETTGYQQLASKIGRPQAQRAVGTAIGANPVSILIPCHRVIQKSGLIGNYRWGTTRKQTLLVREALTAGS
ncbi:MAG: methylated-DNA--[protein]-cysteine S-methyltransferase [Proteobacteria bacterium]|jgi:AraC family transcriptional regulator, regulatory protein of adaptative response / methylated-DNA-[protein]-cysteine methyltransferase|nr:methylated-DNA--[protein]-cysteine S-methyltransferase [Pseudomonadota bacterium]